MNAESRKIVNAMHRLWGRPRGQFPEYAICCPFCGEDRWRFYINVVKQLGYCFKCDQRISPQRLRGLLGLEIVFEKTDIDVLEEELETLARGELIEGFLDRPDDSSCSVEGLLFSEIDDRADLYYRTIKQLTWKHLEDRGFDPSRICSDYRFLAPYPGSFKNARLVLPIYEKDEIVFYQARSLDQGQPKYLNPKKTSAGGKANFVFNLDRIDPSKEVLICEGIFSAIAAGPQAVAVLGKTISLSQYFKILSQGVESVTILFDPGAEQQALESGDLLRGALDVKVAFLQEGDPNEVSRDCLEAAIKGAKNMEDFESSLGDEEFLMGRGL